MSVYICVCVCVCVCVCMYLKGLNFREVKFSRELIFAGIYFRDRFEIFRENLFLLLLCYIIVIIVLLFLLLLNLHKRSHKQTRIGSFLDVPKESERKIANEPMIQKSSYRIDLKYPQRNPPRKTK